MYTTFICTRHLVILCISLVKYSTAVLMFFWRYFSFTIDDYVHCSSSNTFFTEIRVAAKRKRYIPTLARTHSALICLRISPVLCGDVVKLMRSLRGKQKAQFSLNSFIRIVTRAKIGTENRKMVCTFQCVFLQNLGKHRICIDWQVIESVLTFSLRRDHARKSYPWNALIL